jgi:hypothetical protein
VSAAPGRPQASSHRSPQGEGGPVSTRPLRASLALLALLAATPARADSDTRDVSFNLLAGVLGNIPSVSAVARLDFTIGIEKMLFLRVGAGAAHSGTPSGTGPAASASVNTVTLNLVPAIPGGPASPLPGNNQSGGWNGSALGFFTAASVSVPVEVRSNAGAVRISGQATTPLTSGANTLPMSAIAIASSDPANLPAPTVPNAGASAPVNVAPGGPGTAAAPTLLTQRSANWVFSIAPGATPAPGSYSGTITFTASAP